MRRLILLFVDSYLRGILGDIWHDNSGLPIWVRPWSTGLYAALCCLVLALRRNLGKLKGPLANRRFCIPWFFNVIIELCITIILSYRKRFLRSILFWIQNDKCFCLALNTCCIVLLMYITTADLCLVLRLLIASRTDRINQMQSVGPHASTSWISHLLLLCPPWKCMSSIIIMAVNRHFAHNWQLLMMMFLLRSNIIIVHHSVAIYFYGWLVIEHGTASDLSQAWRFLIICYSLLGHLVSLLGAAFRQILALWSLIATLPRHNVLILLLCEVVALLAWTNNFCVARIFI